MSLDDLLDDLSTALGAVEGLRVETDIAASPKPPTILVGPPAFAYEGYQAAPTKVTLPLALVVAANARAIPRLLDLLALVEVAVHDHTDAVLVTAEPGTWPAGGGSSLPAYLIEIEAPV